ncbi:hypothetical protein Fmac_007660 [Flemingia macrophylla]|uniref:Uncharacterized protein n=1 Tax=Flemingia macrophylla TaxID=520843 RepID=A0ABD1MV65_9FABA
MGENGVIWLEGNLEQDELVQRKKPCFNTSPAHFPLRANQFLSLRKRSGDFTKPPPAFLRRFPVIQASTPAALPAGTLGGCFPPFYRLHFEHNIINNDDSTKVHYYHASHLLYPPFNIIYYEVAELTWENGQLSMYELGLPRVPVKPPTTAPNEYTWEKPHASGTLESIVNQVVGLPHHGKSLLPGNNGVYSNFVVLWFNPHNCTTTNTMVMDALVLCSNPEHKK